MGKRLLAEHIKHPHIDASANEDKRTDIAELIEQLAAQIDRVRHIFDGSQNVRTTTSGRDTDVVFIDDLANCMGCSWAKHHDAIDLQIDADAVARCSHLLETSLQVLKRIERLQAGPKAWPAT
jgi:hypothetical protein